MGKSVCSSSVCARRLSFRSVLPTTHIITQSLSSPAPFFLNVDTFSLSLSLVSLSSGPPITGLPPTACLSGICTAGAPLGSYCPFPYASAAAYDE